MTRKTRAQELLDEGYATLEESLSLMAKAEQPTPQDLDGNGKPDDLDDDFNDLDDAQAQSGNGEDTEDDDEEQGSFDGADEDDTDEGQDAPDAGGQGEADAGEADSHEDDTDGSEDEAPASGPVKTLAKADDGFVDAAPILQQLDATLSGIASEMRVIRQENAQLKQQNATLAKAVTGLAEGTRTMAKAFSGAADEPLRSAHQRAPVRVPTAQPIVNGTHDPNTLFAKAEQAVADGRLQILDASVFNTAVTARGAQAALDEYPQVAHVLGVFK